MAPRLQLIPDHVDALPGYDEQKTRTLIIWKHVEVIHRLRIRQSRPELVFDQDPEIPIHIVDSHVRTAAITTHLTFDAGPGIKLNAGCTGQIDEFSKESSLPIEQVGQSLRRPRFAHTASQMRQYTHEISPFNSWTS